jgi:protein-tyrosine-phosphatase
MAAALFDRALAARGVAAIVRSAGTRAEPGLPATDETIAVMRPYEIDLSSHRSREVVRDDLDRADLVVTMSRDQLREIATRAPVALPRMFTLKELARRATALAPFDAEPVRDWASRLGALRRTLDLLGDDPADDVADPIGRPAAVYEDVARELAETVWSIVGAGWPGRRGVDV